MVTGLESFRRWFAEYTDQYTIIGGTACDLLMSEDGLDFRATHARGGGRAEFQCFFPGFECEFAVDIVAGGKTVHFLGKAIEVDEAKIILCRYVLSLYLAYLPAAVYRFCDDSFLFSGLQRGGQAE